MGMLAMIGFPGSGHKYMQTFLHAYGYDVAPEVGLHGVMGWKVALPEFRPTEKIARPPSKEGRNPRVTREPMYLDPVIHLMRNPWQAISSAANLSDEDIALLRNNTHQEPLPIDSWHNKARICIRAFPQWYGMIRDLNPVMTLKIEELESKWNDLRKILRMEELKPYTVFGPAARQSRQPYKTVNYKLAMELVGDTDAARVEVIAKNLYKAYTPV